MIATAMVKITYEIPDDLALRQEMYGTVDPKGCMEIDMGLPIEDIISFGEAEIVSMNYEGQEPS